jgi:hypothetical protein
MVSKPFELAKSRPAETAMPIATVIAALIAKAVGVEDTGHNFLYCFGGFICSGRSNMDC